MAQRTSQNGEDGTDENSGWWEGYRGQAWMLRIAQWQDGSDGTEKRLVGMAQRTDVDGKNYTEENSG